MYKKTRKSLSQELLEARYCLSSVALIPHEVISEQDGLAGARTALTGDLDADGDNDVVAAWRSLVWYENDGTGQFSEEIEISHASIAKAITDIDSDGDLDLITAEDGQLSWRANDGTGQFAPPLLIATVDSSRFSLDVQIHDLNGDGIEDIAIADKDDSKLFWLANDGNGNFASESIIDTTSNWSKLDGADLDNDGDIDLVVQGGGSLTVFANNLEQGNFEKTQVVTNSNDTSGYAIVDVDNDNRFDIVRSKLTYISVEAGTISSYIQFSWFKNNGAGLFADETDLALERGYPASRGNFDTPLVAADIDQDGDDDLFYMTVINAPTINWMENLGNGSFAPSRGLPNDNFANPAQSIAIGDVTQDGIPDLVMAGFFSTIKHKIGYYPFDGEEFELPIDISKTLAGVRDAFAADVDGDGDLDLLSASLFDNKIAWYKNDGTGEFGRQIVIDSTVFAARTVVAADLDGDSDMDVVAAGRGEDRIVWYENDGAENFRKKKIIALSENAPSGQHDLAVADLDGDGLVDIVATQTLAEDQGEIATWYKNLGDGQFDVVRSIDSNHRATTVAVADIDADGDLDVVSSSSLSVIWYENDGTGTFAEPPRLAADTGTSPRSARLIDFNRDGHVDILTAIPRDNTVAWYPNDGRGEFGEANIVTTDHRFVTQADAADFDQDGDLDVVSISPNRWTILWFENLDDGNFSEAIHISRTIEEVATISVADFDNDGDTDILATGYRHLNGGPPRPASITWFENRRPFDVNDDGVFDSSDLIVIFQAGEYEDGIFGNSTFEEGDWNGDGDFDSSDLVLAFQRDSYVGVARPIAKAIDFLLSDFDETDDKWVNRNLMPPVAVKRIAAG